MRKARIIISALTESRVACCTSASESSMPFEAALPLILVPTAISVAAQLPSSAATSSPFAIKGQPGFFHDGPFALFSIAARSSPFICSKNARQLSSTDEGFFSYRA